MAKSRCPYCNHTQVSHDRKAAEVVCAKCGAVLEENMVSLGSDVFVYSPEDRSKIRTGPPPKYTHPTRGLTTEIDKYNRDIHGKKISPAMQAQARRMRGQQRRASICTSMERNLAIALPELDRIASSLFLPRNIREASALLYRRAVEKSLIRGRPIESVVSAVIYILCRQYGIPRTLDEISNVSGKSKKEIGRTYRFVKKQLFVSVPLTNPIHYVPRFATELDLSGEVQEKAKVILEEVISKGLISGRGPTGVAAAAVYIAGVINDERRTQKEVADVAGVTEVTIRNRYRELKRELGIKISG